MNPRSIFRARWALALLALAAIDLLLVRHWTWALENVHGPRFMVNFGLSLVVQLVALYWAAGLRHRHPRWAAFWLLMVFLTYYLQTAYFAVYQKYIGVFDVRFFISDPMMSLSLYAENGSVLRPLLSGALATAVWWWAMGWKDAKRRAWLRWSGLTLASACFALLSANWYSAPHFQLAPVAYAGNLVRALDLRAGKNSDVVIDRPALTQRAAAAGVPDIVWVIGESLNTAHMGLYGYPRDTTPHLSAMQARGELVAFENAVSIGTRTMVSVPYMLHGMQGIDPTGWIYRTPSVFNYASSAGYQTALITAQDFQWRNIDRLFVDADLHHFQQGIEFSPAVNVSVGADDHRVLERGVFPYWARATQNAKPILLVTQMSGSHPPFAAQVPQALKPFLPEPSPNSVNAYDNTVWYTDLYLHRLVQSVRAQRPGAWVFFTSDHGQYVGDGETRFHGDMGDPITHVPLLVFPPPAAMGALKANVKVPVSQADILATVLQLMQTEAVRPIDGLSLQQAIPNDRVRIVSPYMVTLYNDPLAAIVLPNRQRHEIDFSQSSVTWADGRVTPYKELPAEWRARLDARTQALPTP
jgi:glucan phosphoethanolaminetransferase (alkaline phosphatase superfamily)